MNRQQRRAAGRGQDDQRVVLVGLVAQFEGGKEANLDITKLQVIDRSTGRPLFDEVLEPILSPLPSPAEATEGQPVRPSQEFPDDSTQQYTVQFDTPEGKMEYIKNGNFSGIRPVKE